MKRFLFVASLFLAAVSGEAQDVLVEVVRGARWIQSSPQSVSAAAGTNAFYFVARAAGLSGFEPVAGAQVKTPKGTVQALAHAGDGEYAWVQGFATQAARDAAGPVGRYDFSATLNFLGLTKAHAVLADSAAPPVPRIDNYAAAQAIDPDQDFTLRWTAFTGATADDLLDLEIRNSADGGVVSQVTDLDPATTEWTFGSGELPAGTSLTVRVAFRKIGALGVPDAGEFLGGRPAWVSETSAGIRVLASGTGTTDTTPPQLAGSVPADAGRMNTRLDPLLLTFSEAMDPAGRSVQWLAVVNGAPVTLDPALFSYFWVDGGKGLACSYNTAGGGWPAGAAVQWTLNGQAGAPGNFKDVAGNELPRTSGLFLAAGGIDPCADGNASGTPTAAFFFSKQVNYVQTGAEAAVGDPALGADAFAFFDAPSFATSTAIVTLKVPTANPFQFKLKVLTPLTGARDLSLRSFSEHFAGRSDLDDAYIGGTYAMELRNTAATVTNSASLSVPAAGYPPTPHFSNLPAAQQIPAAADFTLGWDAFTGATTNNAFISLAIYDAGSNVVFRVPDPCHGVTLAPGATGVVIPGKTLTQGADYTAELTFGRISDRDKTLPGVPGAGFAFLQKITRAPIHVAGDSGAVTPPRFTQAVATGAGQVELHLTCTPGHLLVLERAPAVTGVFTTLATTNPPSSPLVLTVPMSGPVGILRARNP